MLLLLLQRHGLERITIDLSDIRRYSWRGIKPPALSWPAALPQRNKRQIEDAVANCCWLWKYGNVMSPFGI